MLFTNVQDNPAADPEGQFEVLRAADPVHRFLGAGGLRAPDMPPVGHLLDSTLGYIIREGVHSMTPADRAVFLGAADHRLGARPAALADRETYGRWT